MRTFMGPSSMASLFSIYASITAFITLFQQAFRQLMPKPFQDYVTKKLAEWFNHSKLSPALFTLVIDHQSDNSAQMQMGPIHNQVFVACEKYLCSKLRNSANRIKVTRPKADDCLTFKLTNEQKFSEVFENVQVDWTYVSVNKGQDPYRETRYFEVSVNKDHKEMMLNSYLPFILNFYNETMAKERELKLHTFGGASWRRVVFKHPFTFDSLAMDHDKKKAILDDLDRFVKRKEFYKRVGKAWKRGYLLYGPPGTGKSSLIAAIANHLKFDIYDLQLDQVKDDSALRNLLFRTDNKSILVIEDIDCSLGLPRKCAEFCNPATVPTPALLLSRQQELLNSYRDHVNFDGYNEYNEYDQYCRDEDEYGQYGGDVPMYDSYGMNEYPYQDRHTTSKESKISLSGLLNFLDGLWSSCGDERIIILTTNNKDKLDPALLRPGRMDMHIEMSYLTMTGFRILASNYLGIPSDQHGHPLYEEIESLIQTVSVTAAEIAEVMMRSEDVDVVLGAVVQLLEKKKSEKVKSRRR